MTDIRTAPFRQAQYIRDWKRLHHGLEQRLLPLFLKALNEQTFAVRDFLKRHGSAELSRNLTVLISPQPVSAAYKRAYALAGVEGAAFSYAFIQRTAGAKSAPEMEQKRGEPFGFFSEYWRKLMELFYSTDSATRVTAVTETTRDKIQALLNEADRQGLTTSETATLIEDRLNDPDFNRSRAMLIARTESTTAANYGASLGAESADYLTAKRWVAVMDMNTRPDHVDANGQVVSVTDFFIVGDSEAMYPGDISLPAKEVCNCRCTAAYVPVLSETGVPILK